MRETLTESAKKVLAAAQAAARQLNQDFVGTEHLMLGLLSTESDAGKTLRTLHIDAGKVQASLTAGLPKGAEESVVTGDLSLSPKSQRVLNDAIVKAQAMHEKQVSTRCLMLALLDDLPPAAKTAFSKTGADLHELQRKLTEKPGMPEV